MNIETIYEGKIGVNNVSPQYPLDVSGSVNISSNLIVDTNTFFVDASNNRVGIGTINTNPSSKLTVNSDDSTAAISINRYNKDGPAYLYLRATDGSEGIPTSVTGGRTIGNINFAAYDGTKFIGSVATIAANVDTGSVGSTNMPGNLRFYTRTPNDVSDTNAALQTFERMRITSGGNVGIGTTVPSSTLDVSGTGRISGNFSVDTSSFFVNTTNKYVGVGTNNPDYPLEVIGEGTGKAQVRVRTNNDISSSNDAGILFTAVTDNIAANRRCSIVLDPTGANGIGGDYLYIEAKGDGSTQISNQNNSPLSLQTSKLDRVTILGTGNVGIGTSTPETRLDVVGNSIQCSNQGRFKGWYSGGQGSGLATEIGTLSGEGYINTYDRTAGTYGNLNLIAGSTANIRLQTNGNVGIGTTAPSTTLDVSGSAKFTTIRDISNNTGTSGQVLSSTGSALSWIAPPVPSISTGYAVLRERQNAGVASGVNFSSSTLFKRQLNDVVSNGITITLTGPPYGTFTIAEAGTYAFRGRACYSTNQPTYGQGIFYSRLYISNETIPMENAITGDTSLERCLYTTAPGNINSKNYWLDIDGILPITANTVMSMKMFSYPSAGSNNNGGRAINILGVEEVYAVLTIQKLV